MSNLDDVLVEHKKKVVFYGCASALSCTQTSCELIFPVKANRICVYPSICPITCTPVYPDKAYPVTTDECIDHCPRCAQEKLLAWLRENCELTRTKERNPYLTKEFSTVKNSVASVAGSQGFDRGIDSQLAQDQQTINKILGVK